MERVELLAPAKDLETGMAAVNCGADALYIGGPKFGAREAAGNSLDEIAELIAYAHKYWARVYVTLNTLLYDEELPQAERMVSELYQAGADALIIQDTGLLELDLPPIPLFASTQMHNHTPQRVAFLETVGIQRVILARELSLEQIKAIRAATSVELETFVHGALCVSYSGQCYMSYAAGGRSGNRGQCAQPCRKPYRLVDASGASLPAGSYPLSLRDLNLTEGLPALLAAGVTSFKIEGRLKDKYYVMNVVGHYRQQLDRLLEGKDAGGSNRAGLYRAGSYRAASSGKVTLGFTPDPRKTFNRGFTSYFLHGRKEPVGSPDTPKALGEPLGRVTRLARNSFTLDGTAEIHRGDGLCFFNAERELTGTTVNDAQGRSVFPEKMDGLAAGMLIYRNHDHAFLSALEKSQNQRKIGVRLRLAATRAGLALFAQDEDGCEVMYALDVEKTPAEKPEQALANIEKQLRKLGGTAYECTYLRIDLPEACFVPLSTLNALRRGALEALDSQRLADYPRRLGGAKRNSAPYPESVLSFQGNVLNAQARAFYQRHGAASIEPAAESGLEMRGRKVMTSRHCIKHQLGACPRYSPEARQSPRLAEPLSLVDEQGRRYPLRFNCAECVMEIYAGQIGED